MVKAVIRLDVPEWQIGQEVSVYFKDTMMKHGFCEADQGDISLSDVINVLVGKNDPAEWIEADKLPSSTSFLCPHCREKVYFSHGSSSKSRKNGVSKRCLYRYCPWCGEPVEPLRVNYISD